MNARFNIVITYQGETMIAEDWAKRLDIPANRLRTRIARGKTPKEAVEMGRGRCLTGYLSRRERLERKKA